MTKQAQLHYYFYRLAAYALVENLDVFVCVKFFFTLLGKRCAK